MTSRLPLFYNPPLLHTIKGYTTEACKNDVIDFATGDDIPALTAAYHQSGGRRNLSFENIIRYRISEGNPVFKSVRNGTINGFLIAEPQDDDEVEVAHLYAAQKRQGIGTHLIDAFIQYADAMDVKKIKLDATKEGIQLYRRLGFDCDGLSARTETETYLQQAWRCI